ncbi:MAG: hypothetical protein PWP04_1326 [Candidatus Atribacteria bacterium]|nr:hypothetical protein [Candidatus Atribacteria bacterium]
MKVGIPRGLLFYRFYFFWKTFLEELGAEVITSPPTSRYIVQKGLTYGIEEICFPVKVFLGHVLALVDRVDLLFVPRMVSFYPGEYNCPKILGLPDIVRNLFHLSPEQIIDEEINARNRGMREAEMGLIRLGERFTSNRRKIAQALQKAEKVHREYRQQLQSGVLPETLIDGKQSLLPKEEKVLLLGHTYLLNDSYINMNVIEKINQLGYSIVTPDMVPEDRIRLFLKKVPKPSFWTISNEILGTALSYLKERDPKVKGLVHLVSFECGPDSLVGELIGRWVKKEEQSLPYLRLEIDEHTGEAGLVTRLEAFVDMMRWRDSNLESHFSPFAAS